MQTIRLPLLVVVSIALSIGCDNQNPIPPSPLETINLGEQIAFTENPGCSQFDLTHVTSNNLIIGVSQPALIDLDNKTVTAIPLRNEMLIQNHARIKATETHLWNIYALGLASSFTERDHRIKLFNISTGVETLLIDSLSYDSYYGFLSGLAINEIDIAFNKMTEIITSPLVHELTDSVVYLKNIYGTETESILPIKGTPVSFNRSGNLLLYGTKKGYYQYDFISQQSLFLSPRVSGRETDAFYSKNEPFIVYGEPNTDQPVYIKSLSDNIEILLSEYGSGHMTPVKVSPDERFICLWILRYYDIRDGGFVYGELMLYNFETQQTEIVFRGEQNISFDSEHEFCNWGYPDYGADFSPSGEKLTYMFNGNIYQFSIDK
jgi:hypothetical protein